jgi:hypothetical protein
MSSSTTDTLVRMANQIADFFRIQPEGEAVSGTADHIRRFWDPRMRSKMAHRAQGRGTRLQTRGNDEDWFASPLRTWVNSRFSEFAGGGFCPRRFPRDFRQRYKGNRNGL